jgi:hypothetical protein
LADLVQGFDITFSIAPDSIINEIFLKPIGFTDLVPFESIGRESASRYGWGKYDNITQHDGLFVSRKSAVAIEVKLRSKSSRKQIANYLDITNNTNPVTGLYIRKQTTYSENRIYSYVTLKELRPDLIAMTRQMAANQRTGHPWAKMSDMELIQSAQLYQRDFQSGKKGFSLAAVLTFGGGSGHFIRTTPPSNRCSPAESERRQIRRPR